MSDAAAYGVLALAVVLAWAAINGFMEPVEDRRKTAWLKNQARDPATVKWLRHRLKHRLTARPAKEARGRFWPGLVHGGLFILPYRVHLIIGGSWSLMSGGMRRQAHALQRLADELEESR